MMVQVPNVLALLGDVADGLLGFFDRAFEEGWLLIFLGLLVLFGLWFLFF